MLNQHEPDNEFVKRLEWRIDRELRLRNRSFQATGWFLRSRVRAVLGFMGLMALSMGIGADVVAGAYQAQNKERRAPLISEFQQRAELARQHLASITEQLQRKERDVSLDVAPGIEMLEAQVNLAKAQAQLRLAELHLEEVRITGHDPLSNLSSPLVSGRDFVGEGLRIEMSVPQAALELEQIRLRNTKKRVEVGVVSPIEIEVSRLRIVEVEAAIESFRKKMEIRQSFLNRRIDGPEVELRVLEVEAEQRQKTLITKVELAREELEVARKRVQAGIAQSVLVTEAELRLQKLETDLAKVELDLERTRHQLEQLRIGR
jgi:outer membrane protein TolC